MQAYPTQPNRGFILSCKEICDEPKVLIAEGDVVAAALAGGARLEGEKDDVDDAL